MNNIKDLDTLDLMTHSIKHMGKEYRFCFTKSLESVLEQRKEDLEKFQTPEDFLNFFDVHEKLIRYKQISPRVYICASANELDGLDQIDASVDLHQENYKSNPFSNSHIYEHEISKDRD